MRERCATCWCMREVGFQPGGESERPQWKGRVGKNQKMMMGRIWYFLALYLLIVLESKLPLFVNREDGGGGEFKATATPACAFSLAFASCSFLSSSSISSCISVVLCWSSCCNSTAESNLLLISSCWQCDIVVVKQIGWHAESLLEMANQALVAACLVATHARLILYC